MSKLTLHIGAVQLGASTKGGATSGGRIVDGRTPNDVWREIEGHAFLTVHVRDNQKKHNPKNVAPKLH